CYTDGKKDRTWISYNSEGQKTAIANYKDGLKNGKWKIFNSDGSLIYEIEYLAGVIIDHSEISSNQKKELPSKETPNFF
ncbi:MAG: hypothetical protein HKN22_08080, partial [Bacteroidia bacterium]|nr:hypothetical protein [Bacteroidia bacterium]